MNYLPTTVKCCLLGFLLFHHIEFCNTYLDNILSNHFYTLFIAHFNEHPVLKILRSCAFIKSLFRRYTVDAGREKRNDIEIILRILQWHAKLYAYCTLRVHRSRGNELCTTVYVIIIISCNVRAVNHNESSRCTVLIYFTINDLFNTHAHEMCASYMLYGLILKLLTCKSRDFGVLTVCAAHCGGCFPEHLHILCVMSTPGSSSYPTTEFNNNIRRSSKRSERLVFTFTVGFRIVNL
ncbi:hypothetical protein AGLY_014366 [Aphis glycines]|uniref:Secreted protein n=1 Tax=Aphis glycines TaxID=307491 RepID=A0A6G0T4F6_APHGL|nr:hypothetical protein AGLY_014366 [Aphis glycines]